ncbi:MAG: hypothetical protein AMJ78_10190, partial [Omnitrophica WOR_2 bacterium SM23_29]
MGKGTSPIDNYKKLKAIAEASGAALFGVADITSCKDKCYIEPKSILDDLKYGISVGVRLSHKVLETIVNEPTKIYAFHYKRVNSFLDEIALKISAFIQHNGSSALPIPASQIEDWENQRGAVSHKLVAHLAGLGFIGRSGLLVNPKFGSQVRYVTILTDFYLKTDKPRVGDCGDCYECVKVCPVGAIKQDANDLDLKACRE